MKKLLSLFLFCIVVSYASGQKARISGQIFDPTGGKIYLQQLITNESGSLVEIRYLDSAKLEKGAFKMNTALDSATLLQLYDGNEVTSLVLSPGDDLEVTFHTAFFDETMAYSGKGSKKNQFISDYYIAKERVSNEMGHKIEMEMEKENPDTAALLDYIDKAYKPVKKLIDDYYAGMPEIKAFYNNEMKSLTGLVKWHKDDIKNQVAFGKMRENVLGKPFIEVEAKTLEGKKSGLSAYKGKPVLLDFWATWCGPCKMEMPYLEKIEEEYKDRVNVVSVGVFCEEKAWKGMVGDYSFEHNIFIPRDNTEGLKKEYLLNYIPRYILLDKDLNVVDPEAARPSSGELQGQLDAVLE